MMVLETCHASTSHDISGVMKKFDELNLDSFPGENVTNLAGEALRLIKIMQSGYALPYNLGTRLLSKVSKTSDDYFNMVVFHLRSKVFRFQEPYEIIDPKKITSDDSSLNSENCDDDELLFLDDFSGDHEPYGLPVSSNSSLSTTHPLPLHPFQDVLTTLEPELLEYVAPYPNIKVIPNDRDIPVVQENRPLPPPQRKTIENPSSPDERESNTFTTFSYLPSSEHSITLSPSNPSGVDITDFDFFLLDPSHDQLHPIFDSISSPDVPTKYFHCINHFFATKLASPGLKMLSCHSFLDYQPSS
mmetsp:Transcript_26176/g.37208  ORF Transcript_26176/g.37208 Transcript_26176/m.37208 type:complete len:302 (-) Transcript_26176:53-958(-)